MLTVPVDKVGVSLCYCTVICGPVFGVRKRGWCGEEMSFSQKVRAAVGRKRRVLLVCDEPLFRVGVLVALKGDASLECCAQADNYQEGLVHQEEHQPDLIVFCPVDPQLGDRDAVKYFKLKQPDVKIIVLASQGDTVFAERALRDGAQGFLLKRSTEEELLDAAKRALQGELVVSPRLAHLLLSRVLHASSTSESVLADLSAREREVFELVGNGCCTREIAAALHISVKTVETHQSRIKKKLTLANSTELVHFATQWLTNLRIAEA